MGEMLLKERIFGLHFQMQDGEVTNITPVQIITELHNWDLCADWSLGQGCVRPHQHCLHHKWATAVIIS